mmetsp:Transcript_28310/g.56768  ORF Transcript_28310/g.56768 Transcript_28310/m.56768 type:complete len:554 (+) Transcript_28310:125-1786(+)
MSAIRLHIQSLLPLMASFPIGPCGVTASINPAFIPTNSFHPRCHYLRPNSSGTAPGRPPFLSSTDGRTNIQSRTTDRHPPSLPFHTAISPSRLSTRAGRMTRCHSSPFSELDTALEWLARERSSREKSNHSSLPGRDGGDNVTGSRSGDANGDGGAKRNEIQWFSPTEFQKDEGDDDERRLEWETMPLYPLGEVHVPFSGENHALINTEPRNVKMARDIVDGKWNDNLFCVALRARDTNRIASVGTIMQLIHADETNGTPSRERVKVTCRAVGIARIMNVTNPMVWEGTKDDDGMNYLVAQVKIRQIMTDESSFGNDVEDDDNGKARSTIHNGNQNGNSNNNNHNNTNSKTTNERLLQLPNDIIQNYQKIKSIYKNSKSIANSELPNFARDVMTTMPDYTDPQMIRDETKFWKMVDTWQKMCNTVKHIKRYRLQGYVNEILIEVAESMARKKGEPLELPVRREKMPEWVQRQIESMEERASKEFMELGMDPVLDFQEILIMEGHWERVHKLAEMVERERLRLEAKESLIKAFLKDVEEGNGMPGALKDTGGFN